jgi:hypothetical protein
MHAKFISTWVFLKPQPKSKFCNDQSAQEFTYHFGESWAQPHGSYPAIFVDSQSQCLPELQQKYFEN